MRFTSDVQTHINLTAFFVSLICTVSFLLIMRFALPEKKEIKKKWNSTFHVTSTYICNVLPGFLIDCPANVTEASAQRTAHTMKAYTMKGYSWHFLHKEA